MTLVALMVCSSLSYVAGSVRAATTLQLVEQSRSVTADGDFTVVLEWSGSTESDLNLVFTVYAPIESSGSVGSPPTSVLNRSAAVPLDDLPRNEQGQIVAQLAVRSSTPGDLTRVLLPDPGVYPVAVEIRAGDTVRASVTTTMIRLPTEVAETELLPVGFLISPTAADGMTLADLTQVLAAHPNPLVTVYLGSGVVAQLGEDLDRTSAFVEALNGRPVIAGPRVDLDPSALAEIGEGELYAVALSELWTELESFGIQPQRTVAPIDAPLTAEGARLLLDVGVNTVYDTTQRLGPGSLAAGSGANDQLAVLVPEVQLSDELGAGTSVPDAHRLLADLTLRAESVSRPVLIGADREVDPASLDILLGAFEEIGLLEMRQVDQSFAGTLPVRPTERAAQDLAGNAAQIRAAQELISDYTTFHVAGTSSPAVFEANLAMLLSRELNPGARSDGLEALLARLDDAFDVITFSASQDITLAARRSVIPLAIENRASGPRRLLLRFGSDRIGVLVDSEAVDEVLVEVPSGASTIDVEVEARSVGASPLEVVAQTPGGGRELAQTRFQVRSTAVPGLGFALIGTAFVFLVVWWVRSLRSTRGARRPASDNPGSDGPASDGPASDEPGSDGSASEELGSGVELEEAPTVSIE